MDCGHSFCDRCVFTWFKTKLNDHIGNHGGYDARSFVPAPWILALKDRNLPWVARLTILARADEALLRSSHPRYTCPSCRRHVKNAPIPNLSLKQASRALYKSEDPVVTIGTRPNWSDLFPVNVREFSMLWYVHAKSSNREPAYS